MAGASPCHHQRALLDDVVLSQYGGLREDGKVEVFGDLLLLDNSKILLGANHKKTGS